MTAAEQKHRSRIAVLGERAAEDELWRRGYRVLARNYRCRGGEADLVAAEGGDLVFVEVKARTGFDYGLPQEAVGWTKQRRLGKAAAHYCHSHPVDDLPVRFDVVEVVILRNQVAAVEVIQDAFTPDL